MSEMDAQVTEKYQMAASAAADQLLAMLLEATGKKFERNQYQNDNRIFLDFKESDIRVAFSPELGGLGRHKRMTGRFYVEYGRDSRMWSRKCRFPVRKDGTVNLEAVVEKAKETLDVKVNMEKAKEKAAVLAAESSRLQQEELAGVAIPTEAKVYRDQLGGYHITVNLTFTCLGVAGARRILETVSAMKIQETKAEAKVS